MEVQNETEQPTQPDTVTHGRLKRRTKTSVCPIPHKKKLVRQGNNILVSKGLTNDPTAVQGCAEGTLIVIPDDDAPIPQKRTFVDITDDDDTPIVTDPIAKFRKMQANLRQGRLKPDSHFKTEEMIREHLQRNMFQHDISPLALALEDLNPGSNIWDALGANLQSLKGNEWQSFLNHHEKEQLWKYKSWKNYWTVKNSEYNWHRDTEFTEYDWKLYKHDLEMKYNSERERTYNDLMLKATDRMLQKSREQYAAFANIDPSEVRGFHDSLIQDVAYKLVGQQGYNEYLKNIVKEENIH